MSHRWYAVVTGITPGIYDRWYGGALEQVQYVPNALYRRFSSEEGAREWYASQTDPHYKAEWQTVDLSGFAVTVMLKPHGGGLYDVQLLGSNLYQVDTDEQARQAGLAEFWTTAHDHQGTPIVEVHGPDAEPTPESSPSPELAQALAELGL
jgi:hypothetical protein